METIKEQIAEWDKPVDVNEVKPRIITLHNSDPVKMAALLSTLFTEMEQGRRTYLDYIFGTGRQDKKKIVGPLYGKLTFEAVPDTKKIIVISMIPEAYAVVEQIVEELDQKEMAEVPVVVTLKYADPEDLSERLNAIFNEPGTLAKIRLSKTGLTDRSMDEGDQGDTPSGSNNESEQQTTQGEYTPWWSSGGRVRPDEMPISNVIGRIRFIPDPRSKAILVLSPPEHTERIREMIEALDVPGMQVRIKSIVVEVDHRNLTSLGLQLATDPGAFGTLDENAITALTSLTHLTSHGSLAVTAGAPESGDTGSATLLDAATNVTFLIDFLVKRVDAKVLNEQTLWTKDNEEADFFKGQKVAFITSSTVSAEGQRDTTNLTYPEIGMIMQVRPRITPEKDVDMTVRLEVSQRTAELINGQPVRNKMRTGTTLIVQDGETIMLGGMLFQEDSTIERKVPLLGDIPLIGGLFRHNEIVKANVETLVFVTPYVIDEDPSKMLAETKKDIETQREKLKEILTELRTATEEAG
jgi:general secretion pathway protein D